MRTRWFFGASDFLVRGFLLPLIKVTSSPAFVTSAKLQIILPVFSPSGRRPLSGPL